MEFKIGDKVKAFGLFGIVKKSRYVTRAPLLIELEDGSLWCFTIDGKLQDTHKEPTLFLAKKKNIRPKKEERSS